MWTLGGPETLVLVTCGGDFNPEIRRYRHNIVVYAIPADDLSTCLRGGRTALARYTATVFTSRSPDEVFAFMADLRNLPVPGTRVCDK